MVHKYFIKAKVQNPKEILPTESIFGPVFSKKIAQDAFLIIIKKRNVISCKIVEEEDEPKC